MTSLPCQRLGFPDRGLLRPGMAADIVCLDPERVRDTATYEEPRQLPEGIPYVVVNGRVVVDDAVLLHEETSGHDARICLGGELPYDAQKIA